MITYKSSMPVLSLKYTPSEYKKTKVTCQSTYLKSLSICSMMIQLSTERNF